MDENYFKSKEHFFELNKLSCLKEIFLQSKLLSFFDIEKLSS